MNENQIYEFHPRNSKHIQVQAGAFIGLILFAVILRLLGFDESGRFLRQILFMLPVFVLMPVIFNIVGWPVHRNNRIEINEDTITGPTQIGLRLEKRTFRIEDIDLQRTESASLYAKLFGPIKIYATNGDTIALDVLGLGRSQIRQIYAKIGCIPPVFPFERILEQIRQYIQSHKRNLLHQLLMVIAGTWLFMVFVEELEIFQSTLAAYFIGMICGIGLFYCFTQLNELE